MNTKKWIIAIGIIVGSIALYIALKPSVDSRASETPIPETSDTVENKNQTTTPPGKTSSTGTSNTKSTNLVTNKDWHIAFTKSNDWITTPSTIKNKIVLSQTSGTTKGDSLIVEYVMGDHISDVDAKFGTITYYYDKSARQWLETDDQGIKTVMQPSPAKIVAYTQDKLPVFPGTGRWLTYIIPLSTTTFLKFNITGSGSTQALQDLVKTIHKI